MQNMLPKQTNKYQNANALANTTTNSNTNKDWHKNKNSPKIKYGLKHYYTQNPANQNTIIERKTQTQT